jgi:hypothetical protein
MRSEAEIRALRAEGTQYVAAGMIDRAKLVNAELALLGVEPVALPKQADAAPAQRQTRTSTQAATRRKRST